ncbi:MAG: GNAT family N-acetyltransferase [Bacteroidota bacterium]
MGQLSFRYARPSDLSDLNYISIAAKKHWGYPQDWIDRWMSDLRVTEKDLAERIVLLAEADHEVVGFTIVSDCRDYYEIDHLWILPKYIGRGYGRQLLVWTMEHFLTQVKRLIVVADPNAEGFYKKMGFETYDKIESYPPGRFLPVMELTSS